VFLSLSCLIFPFSYLSFTLPFILPFSFSIFLSSFLFLLYISHIIFPSVSLSLLHSSLLFSYSFLILFSFFHSSFFTCLSAKLSSLLLFSFLFSFYSNFSFISCSFTRFSSSSLFTHAGLLFSTRRCFRAVRIHKVEVRVQTLAWSPVIVAEVFPHSLRVNTGAVV
jgi:hypothetical protein